MALQHIRKVILAGLIFDCTMEYTDTREGALAVNTFLNHRGADLELTGFEPRKFALKIMLLTKNESELKLLDQIWKTQKEPVRLSVPKRGVFTGFIKNITVNRNGEKEGFDLDVDFWEHIPAPRPAILKQQQKKALAGASTSQTTKTYKVKKGDSYWRIAQKFLGDGRRWKEIFALNKQYAPRRIPIGVVLTVST